MRSLFLLGSIFLLLTVCQGQSCKQKFDAKVLELAQADSSNLFAVSDVAKITSWIADFAIKHPRYTMPQIGDAILTYVRNNFLILLPVWKMLGFTPIYARGATCLKKQNTDVFAISRRVSPAIYTTLRAPFAKCQQQLIGNLNAKKSNAVVTEDIFCTALTYATPQTMRGFVKAAKCSIRCAELACAKETFDKFTKLGKYDHPSFTCGTCVSG